MLFRLRKLVNIEHVFCDASLQTLSRVSCFWKFDPINTGKLGCNFQSDSMNSSYVKSGLLKIRQGANAMNALMFSAKKFSSISLVKAWNMTVFPCEKPA